MDAVSLEPFPTNLLSGPRQVGKTTLIRLLIHEILKRSDGRSVLYLPCDEVADFRALSGLKAATFDSLYGAQAAIDANAIHDETLSRRFGDYLSTGGFPLAIRELVRDGRAGDGSRKALLDGLRGYWLRLGRSDGYMKEVIRYLVEARWEHLYPTLLCIILGGRLEVKLREKGRITIPAKLRRDLGLIEGEGLELMAKDGSLVLRPKRLTTAAQVRGILGPEKVRLEDVESALGEDTS